MTVVVVGAGIAGLAAAWELTAAGVDLTILESERRAGGVIVTERMDGFVVEGGPDGWLAAQPEIPALAAELGVADRVVGQSAHGSLLWTGTDLEPLEEGRAAALLGIEAKGEALAAGFSTFAAGMGELIEALVARVGPTLRTPLGVTGVTPDGSGWRLAVTGGAMIEADGVVLALPAYAAGRLLEQAGASGARALGEVTYFPSVTVSLAYDARQVGAPLEGTGFVSPPQAGGAVRACTYASRKFPGRAPAGRVLLRAFLGPCDGDPGEVAHRELAHILRLTGAPLWTRAFFWSKGIPRYTRHHGERVAAVRARLARLNPLAIGGAGYDGAGVSACVRSGREAARAMLGRVGS